MDKKGAMMFKKKLKAGSLQATILMSILIFTLLSMLLIYTFLQRKLNDQTNTYVFLNEWSYELFDSYSNTSIENQSEIDDISTKNYQVKSEFSSSPWGYFSLNELKVSKNEHHLVKRGLVSGSSRIENCLVLKDNSMPLTLVGNTKLIGGIKGPKKGVVYGSVSGVSYTLNRDHNESLTINNVGIHKPEKARFPTNYPLIMSEKNEIILFDSLPPFSMIVSDTLIQIWPQASLSNVIVKAPRIEVLSGFKGSIQAFANQHIIVEPNCELEYPSVLSYSGDNEKNNTGIWIQENSKITGMIYAEGSSDKTYTTIVDIESNAQVIGQVYSELPVKLSGSIHGTIQTEEFVAKVKGRIYRNHIYNGTISNASFPEYFTGFSYSKQLKKTALWLK